MWLVTSHYWRVLRKLVSSFTRGHNLVIRFPRMTGTSSTCNKYIARLWLWHKQPFPSLFVSLDTCSSKAWGSPGVNFRCKTFYSYCALLRMPKLPLQEEQHQLSQLCWQYTTVYFVSHRRQLSFWKCISVMKSWMEANFLQTTRTNQRF